MSTIDDALDKGKEEEEAQRTPVFSQGNVISSASRAECSAVFAYLETSDGERFLQRHYERLQIHKRREQQRKGLNRASRSKLLRLVDAKKYEEWEEQKFEIFFYYMQNLSADGIEKAMKTAGHMFSTPSSRTLINRLENWGFTLNRQFRRTFISSARERVAWKPSPHHFFDDEIFGSKSPIDLAQGRQPNDLILQSVEKQISDRTKSLMGDCGTSYNKPDSPPVDSLSVSSLVRPDAGLPESRSVLSHVHQDLTWQSFNNPLLYQPGFDNVDVEDLPDPPEADRGLVLTNLLDMWNQPDPELNRMMGLDDHPGTLVHEMIEQMEDGPRDYYMDFGGVVADVDSGYYSMEMCETKGPHDLVPRNEAEEHRGSVDNEPATKDTSHAMSSTNATAQDISTHCSASQIPPSVTRFPINSSILHRIPCEKDHARVVFGLSGTCECGVSKAHAICMLMTNLQDAVVLSFLSNINEPNELDRAGNTILHYAATAGRKSVLEYVLKSGVNVQHQNSLGQNFLHVLDPTCFGNQLVEFLSAMKAYNILFQRDYTGRTVLHGLLHYPLERIVCNQLIDFYGGDEAHQFALRDNQGRDAAEYLRNKFPYSFYNHPNYLETIGLFEKLAESFVFKSTTADPISPQVISGEHNDRRTVLQRVLTSQGSSFPNLEDWSGSNALHCLSYWPEGRDEGDVRCLLVQMQHLISLGIDLNSYDRDGRTPLLAYLQNCAADEDEFLVEPILRLLVESGANVHMQDRYGKTAIYHAVIKGFSSCVAILLQHGARVNIVAGDGRSLRQIAQESLSSYFHVQDDAGRKLFQQRLAIMSALVDHKAEVEPTTLQQWGINPSKSN